MKVPRLILETETREKQWQEEFEKQRHKHVGEGRRREESDLSDNDDAEAPRPLLDQKPAVPGIDPRDLTNIAGPPPVATPGGMPVPDIKLENHDVEAANYSTNV